MQKTGLYPCKNEKIRKKDRGGAGKRRCGKGGVLLCGFYGCGNLGDDALLLSILSFFSRECPKLRLSYLTGGDRFSSALLWDAGIRANAYPRMRPSALRAVAESDAVILGGGSVLQNATGQASLLYYLSLLRLAQLLGKKTAILAGGLGPIEGDAAKRAVSRVLARLDYASFRDEDALRLASSLGARDATLSADPALLLSPSEIPTGVVLPARFFLVCPRKKSGISVSSHARQIFALSQKFGLVPVLYALFSDEDAGYIAALAREISGLYAARGEKRAAWVLPRLSPTVLLSVIKRASFVLSMRYHAALFALSVGVPFFVIGRDPKLRALKKESAPEELRRRVEMDLCRVTELL